MANLKNLARRKARQAMHNSEDARVTEAVPPHRPPIGRLAWIKNKAVLLAKFVKRIPFYIWLWGKAAEFLDYLDTVVIPFVENLL